MPSVSVEWVGAELVWTAMELKQTSQNNEGHGYQAGGNNSQLTAQLTPSDKVYLVKQAVKLSAF